jgi:hypothetical protein
MRWLTPVVEMQDKGVKVHWRRFVTQLSLSLPVIIALIVGANIAVHSLWETIRPPMLTGYAAIILLIWISWCLGRIIHLRGLIRRTHLAGFEPSIRPRSPEDSPPRSKLG